MTDWLLSLKKGSNSVDEYLQWFRMLCDSLAVIKKPINELDKKFQLGRGPKYLDFRIINMLAKPLYSSFTPIVSALQGHEQLLLDEAREKKQHINHEQACFGQRGRGRGNNGRFNPKGWGGFPSASCTGHNGNTNQQFGNKNNKWKDIKPSQQTKSQDPSEEEKVICKVCFKANHTTLDCWHKFDFSYQTNQIPEVLATINLNEENHDPTFYADLGATSHMANDTGKMSHIVPYKGNDSIYVGNRERLKITHVGEVKINTYW